MEDDVDRQKLLGQPSHQRVGQPVTDLDHLTLQVQVNFIVNIDDLMFSFVIVQGSNSLNNSSVSLALF